MPTEHDSVVLVLSTERYQQLLTALCLAAERCHIVGSTEEADTYIDLYRLITSQKETAR